MTRASAGVPGKKLKEQLHVKILTPKVPPNIYISSPMRRILCSFSNFSKPSPRPSFLAHGNRSKAAQQPYAYIRVPQKVQSCESKPRMLHHVYDFDIDIAVDTYVGRPFELTSLRKLVLRWQPRVTALQVFDGPDQRVVAIDRLQLTVVYRPWHRHRAVGMKDAIASPPHEHKGQTKPFRNAGQGQETQHFT